MFGHIISVILLGTLSMSCSSSASHSDHSSMMAAATVVGTMPDSLPAPVTICQLMTHPDDYAGKMVLVEGTVKAQCPGGHWLTLQCDRNKKRTMYVDLTANKLTVPQAIKSGALIWGEFVKGAKLELKAVGIKLASAEAESHSGTGSHSGSCCH